MRKLKIFGKEFTLPRHKWLRILLGIAFITGGILGFLPILGIWMLPLGIVILSIDISAVRRFRRKVMVKWKRRGKKTPK